MTEVSLDNIDKKIIKLLWENARTTIADIARKIGKLTENAIRYRIERLEYAFSLAILTLTRDTPGTLESPFSTVAAQEAQVIPVMGSMVFLVGSVSSDIPS